MSLEVLHVFGLFFGGFWYLILQVYILIFSLKIDPGNCVIIHNLTYFWIHTKEVQKMNDLKEILLFFCFQNYILEYPNKN